MISFEHQCIFLHVPKCGGTSIEAALGHFQGCPSWGDQDHRTLREIMPLPVSLSPLRTGENRTLLKRRFSRHPQSKPENNYRVSRDQYGRFFKFAFVRNPWDRVFSAYRNVARDPKQMHSFGLTTMPRLIEFIRRFAPDEMLLRPQTYWLEDFSGRVNFDFIGQFENLERDFAYVASRLGRPEISLPHMLDGGRSDYRAAYSPEARDLVGSIYAREIALFSFGF